MAKAATAKINEFLSIGAPAAIGLARGPRNVPARVPTAGKNLVKAMAARR